MIALIFVLSYHSEFLVGESLDICHHRWRLSLCRVMEGTTIVASAAELPCKLYRKRKTRILTLIH